MKILLFCFIFLLTSALTGCIITSETLEVANQARAKWNYSYSSPQINYVKIASLKNNNQLSVCFTLKNSNDFTQKEYTYSIDLSPENISKNSSIKSDFFIVHEMDNLSFSLGCQSKAKDENLIPVIETKPKKFSELTKSIKKSALYIVNKENPVNNYLILTSPDPIIYENKVVILKPKKVKKINGVSIDKELLLYAAVPFTIVADAAFNTVVVVMALLMGNCSSSNSSKKSSTKDDVRIKDKSNRNSGCSGGF
ncbi:hypothetical protein [Spartinivicinus ruber]|uniref:hypothetical protein n=1 Tax=Spartinivicinus ruber TaxID=2683272 RepID=UPI0013D6557C|nr:hypothetical protein [Spartinivicinus ruber]